MAHRVSIRSRQDVFLIDGFLSAAECSDWIARSESSGYEQASISTAVGQRIAKDVRNNDRLIWDDPELAIAWWRRAQSFIPRSFGVWHALGFNERFRFYRYRPGQRFAQHLDGSFQRSATESSWMTFMVYLNDDFTGGTTRFDLAHEPDPVDIVPKAGSALVFMHDRLHTGSEVLSGVKYVLRTDIMFHHPAGREP